ncbi:MAG: GNAT family N-acetyltransferase [Pseudomonadota bacterium]|nr:GNAT family N-acetyltransferase [Pseudomonadota bacterium]
MKSDLSKIMPAESELQYRQVRELFAELASWDTSQVSKLGLDGQKALDFYYASGEDALPGVYAPPDGGILLATHLAQAAGCAGFHGMTKEVCEIKRMYVRPEFRRMQIGRQLTEHLIVTAKEAGYLVMRLETVTFMDKAIAMYSSFGFKTCEPYYAIPESFRAITVFMQLILADAR